MQQGEERRRSRGHRRVAEESTANQQRVKAKDPQALRLRRKRRRKIMIKCQIIVAAVAVMICGYVIWDKMEDGKGIGCRTSVSGLNVSWMTEEEAAAKIEKKFAQIPLRFEEDGQVIYQVTLEDAGYSLDHDALVRELEDLRAKQEPCHSLFEKHKNYEISCPVKVQEDQRYSALSASHFDTGKERTGSKDAYIKYNEEKNHYEIIGSEQGNMIDESKLQEKTEEFLDASFAKELLKSPLDFQMNEEVYQAPKVGSEQEALQNQLKELNGKLAGYYTSTVTYTFGDVTEVLNQDVISQWVVKEEGNIHLDDDAVWQYVYDLADKYDTIYKSRFFTCSHGYEVQIDQNEYGYQIDQNAEFEQLEKDLASGEHVERDPIYSKEALGRNGDDDLLGNYIEVDLTQQHMWLYKDGQMILESDIISGRPVGVNKKTGEEEDWSTHKGAFPIAYKESPATLSSDIYGYETDVQYWMPFVEGQGLHDADWQTSFGGTTYQYAGSHGCINLPPYVAAELYNNITAGYAVLIY